MSLSAIWSRHYLAEVMNSFIYSGCSSALPDQKNKSHEKSCLEAERAADQNLFLTSWWIQSIFKCSGW